MKEKNSRRERLRKGLRKMFEMHLDEYVSRLEEVGGFGVGGIEPEVSLPSPTIIRTKQEKEQFELSQAVYRFWENATLSYIYGNFRACIFQLGTMLEATLKFEISRRGLKKSLKDYLKGKNATLGRMIGFCDKKNVILSKENGSLKLAGQVNKLRVDHIHLLLEQEMSEDVFKITKRDEFISLDEFRGEPPVKISNGWISGDGATFIMDFLAKKRGILYKYKADAKRCLNYAQQILNFLYKDDAHEG